MKIDEEFRIDKLLHQKTYLSEGKLIEWEGKTDEVYSTISSTEEYKPTFSELCHIWMKRLP